MDDRHRDPRRTELVGARAYGQRSIRAAAPEHEVARWNERRIRGRRSHAKRIRGGLRIAHGEGNGAGSRILGNGQIGYR